MKKIFASVVAMMFALVCAGTVFAAEPAMGDNAVKVEKKAKKTVKKAKKSKKAKKAVDNTVEAPVVK